jgi:hypothetical protein
VAAPAAVGPGGREGRLRRGLWGGAGRPGAPPPAGCGHRRARHDTAWAPLVGRLGCLRGVGVLTAFGLAVEVGDGERFTGARIGADLGLVPAEHSSGTQRVQGSITKTGTTHARRLRSRAPGTTASRIVPAESCNAARLASRPWSGKEPSAATAGCTSAGAGLMAAASAPPSASWPSPASSPDGAGAWRSWTPDASSPQAGRWQARRQRQERPATQLGAPARAGDARSLDQRTALDAHPVMR